MSKVTKTRGKYKQYLWNPEFLIPGSTKRFNKKQQDKITTYQLNVADSDNFQSNNNDYGNVLQEEILNFTTNIESNDSNESEIQENVDSNDNYLIASNADDINRNGLVPDETTSEEMNSFDKLDTDFNHGDEGVPF